LLIKYQLTTYCYIQNNVAGVEMKMILEAIEDKVVSAVRQEKALQIRQVAARTADICGICGERLAYKTCESCEQRMCNACAIFSTILPLSFFCSEECRDEAELAAQQARQTDVCQRWR
jgi:hypothetical protein